MVSIQKGKQTGFKLRRKGQRFSDVERVGLVVAGLCTGFLGMFLYSVVFAESSVDGASGAGDRLPEALRKTKKHPELMETTDDGDNANIEDPKHPPIKHVRRMDNGMNAIALDILEILNCDKLLKEAEESLKSTSFTDDGVLVHRRRLQQHGDDGGFADFGNHGGDISQEQNRQDRDIEAINDDSIDIENPNLDDIAMGQDFVNYVDLSAKHLFCLAASEKPPEAVTSQIVCDASKKKRKTLLELWSAARAQITNLDLLERVLDLARENQETILGKSYNLWAPMNDDGIKYMVETLNSDANVDKGGLNGLEEALGPGKIYVDVGSCLGVTCLVINDKYPGTKIVSLEPASPNWLLQEINLRCNLPRKEFKRMKVILAGVGSNTEEEDYMMAKLMWRPTSTTSTRSWTPSLETLKNDEEIVVRLRSLKSILAEANAIQPTHIDVLNVDCQGCEYNMVPSLTEEEFEKIPTVTGSVHWGYIEVQKLPSSKRGKTTHERLCKHENIARDTKECCEFPDMPVKSSVPGVVLEKDDSKGFPPLQVTVSDVIDAKLCDNFSAWRIEHFLNDVSDDFNWSELSSQA